MIEKPTLSDPNTHIIQPDNSHKLLQPDKHLWRLYIVKDLKKGTYKKQWCIRVSDKQSKLIMDYKGRIRTDEETMNRNKYFSLERATKIASDHINTMKINFHTAVEASANLDHIW